MVIVLLPMHTFWGIGPERIMGPGQGPSGQSRPRPDGPRPKGPRLDRLKLYRLQPISCWAKWHELNGHGHSHSDH